MQSCERETQLFHEKSCKIFKPEHCDLLLVLLSQLKIQQGFSYGYHVLVALKNSSSDLTIVKFDVIFFSIIPG